MGARNLLFRILVISGGIALLVFYFLFDPMEWSFMPQCLFHKVTGLQCMGCGSQRVVHCLLHGDLSGAFRANTLIVCMLPLLILAIYVELFRHRHPKLYSEIHRPWVIITAAAFLLVWLPLRNILGI